MAANRRNASKSTGPRAAADAQLTAPMEMSDLRETDHGPGRFLLCMRVLERKHPAWAARLVILAAANA